MASLAMTQSVSDETVTPDEERLLALWAQGDRMEQELRAFRASVRQQEIKVGRANGFVFPPNRETLQRTILRKK